MSALNGAVRLANHKITITTVLNMSDTCLNWKNSEFDKSTYERRFLEINKKVDRLITINQEVMNDPKFLGCNHHRIETYHRYIDYDYIIFLDVDVVFSKSILKNYLDLLYTHTIPTFSVISPQILRLWDTTWDCIVNENYINTPLNSYKTTDIQKVHAKFSSYKVSLELCKTYKFAGGWFTAYKPALLNHITIPETFGGYGPDDTFIMACMHLMHRKSQETFQFFIKNEIITERPITNPGPGFINTTHEQRHFAMKNFYPELRKFLKKL